MKNKIPEEEYKEIIEKMPICCVDAVIHHNKKVLLIYRNREPCKAYWWIPGGGIHKNEKIEDAVIRKVKEEVGIEIKIERQIGTYEFFSSKCPFDNLKTGVHTICITFLVKPIEEKFNVRLDYTSSNYKWIDKIERDFHPYIKRVLKNSGIFD